MGSKNTCIPRNVEQRLIREACEHLSSASSTKSLRDICRRFLKQRQT